MEIVKRPAKTTAGICSPIAIKMKLNIRDIKEKYPIDLNVLIRLCVIVRGSILSLDFLIIFEESHS